MKYYDRAVCDIPGETKTKLYKLWHSMVQRCYDAKHLARQPHYARCTVCQEWLKFSAFKMWAEAHYKDGLHLDKDIKGNGKLYSPETCIFVPRWVNQFVVQNKEKTGPLPTGVKPSKDKFIARCRHPFAGPIHLGSFSTIEEAEEKYKDFKRNVVVSYTKELRTIAKDLPELLLTKLESNWSES